MTTQKLSSRIRVSVVLVVSALAGAAPAACSGSDGGGSASGGDAGSTTDAGADADAGAVGTCTYEPMPSTARAGGTVAPGAISVGAAEADLALPVGSALGAYTSRVNFAGGAGRADSRLNGYSGSFIPSYGVEQHPKVKALAITAGDETVVIVRVGIGAAYGGLLFEVEKELGDDYAGKVLLATSHSHSAPGHWMGNSILQLGFGAFRERSYQRVIEVSAEVARAALDARVPASIGIAHDPDFDPENRVNRDRRPQNDDLPGGANRKDRDLFVLRADTLAGAPIAIVPVFGVHPTVLPDSNNLVTPDVVGKIERALEESFDERVMVMHLQGAAGDVSPAGSGGIDCSGDACYDFARAESVGRYARDMILDTWRSAEGSASTELPVEMLTRVVELGPDLETFEARNGELRYTPYDASRVPDLEMFDADGEVISPIDEFNVEFGAALCGTSDRRGSGIRYSRDLAPYESCSLPEDVLPLLSIASADDLLFEDPMPACATTRTVVSALRIGEHLFVTMPGEPVTLLVDRMRAGSPVPGDRTVIIGYAQDHVGYLLHADDWLRGGYEPSINVWGPIEGEYVAERALEVAALAVTPEREDGYGTGMGRDFPIESAKSFQVDSAPSAGTVPDELPEGVYVRGRTVAGAQPPASVERLGLAHFVWIGEDPLAGTPTVTLQRDRGDGTFEDVVRRSGRVVRDEDLLTFWTPLPLKQAADRTHYWAVEWQAVVPWGTEGLDELADRPGLALGRYRFHVSGTGYELDSEPFEVVAGSLDVAASVAGSSVELDAAYFAPEGYRLLDLQVRSNQRVPVRVGPLDIELELSDGRTLTFAGTPVSDGVATVDAGADIGLVTLARATDRFGNSGTAQPQ